MPKELQLFDDLAPTKHAGGSPWARYKEAQGGQQDAKIGWLTFQIDNADFIQLVRWAENTPKWREKIIEAINGLCSF